jgi:aryl-alcohol dehydrogenase-like predicted oxidoreductase
MELGIGTAQFGLDYGITNKSGAIPEEDQRRIIAALVATGLRYIDTAPGYGHAESMLGRYIGSYSGTVRCVTKGVAAPEAGSLESQLRRSLSRLGLGSTYAFLVHDFSKMAQSAVPSIAAELAAIKEQGLATKVGASLYTIEDLELFLSHEVGDIVQVPMNVLDWRFLDTPLASEAKKRGIEIHGRSLFLQGALCAWSDQLSAKLEPLRDSIERFSSWCSSVGHTSLEGCWAFARAQQIVDVFIVGVEGSRQFWENLAAYQLESFHPKLEDFEKFKEQGPLLDPRNWTR